ncbi:MAG: RES family NAD+ phosphorylase [Vicinamibacterales bacterium]
MIRVYRICRKRSARKALDGEGAYRFGGRWSSPGVHLAYTAEHLSLAIIEYFVHIDPHEQPADLMLVSGDVPDSVSRTLIPISRLPPDWRNTPPPPELAHIGDDFFRHVRAAVLIVPSALAPTDSNWLINPRHPEFRKIRAHEPEPFQHDPRFLSR